jgi:hypothetical protein
VSRRDDVVGALGLVDRGCDGARAIGSRDPRRDAVLGFDRDRKSCAQSRAVGACHGLEAKCIGARLGNRQADQPAAVLGHEVDRVGRRHLGRDNEIAFVFAILGIDQNDHAAIAQILQNLGDVRDEPAPFGVGHMLCGCRHVWLLRSDRVHLVALERLRVSPLSHGRQICQ